MKMLIPFSIFCALLGGCGTGENEVVPPEDEDLVSSYNKEDTGYYSDLATELEGVYQGTLQLDLGSMSDSERQEYVTQLQNGGWQLTDVVNDHIKFGKLQLNTEKLHMNLSAGQVDESQVTLDGTTVTVAYKLRIETIVLYEDLRKDGIDPASLQGKVYNAKLPADPRDVFAKAGEKCAEGFDPGSLEDYNYFYYFKPDKPGCDLALTDATFTLNTLLPRKTTYPEYNRLVADRKVTVAVFFGAAGHEETIPTSDEGVREHREFISALTQRNFRKTVNLNPGERYQRVKSGITEVVDVRSPYDLHALNDDSQGLFKQALLEHEIVIYDGHSFYGSLDVFEDPSAYPPDTYQIVFSNSCWSNEYYNQKVLQMKATDRDPTGWELADVVNNTEPAWFTNMGEETRILLTNIFAGCETGGMDGTRKYNWEGIIQAMNKFALDRQASWGLESHEVYGVSGVRTNCYDPLNPTACNGQGGGGGGGGQTITKESTTVLDIPDDSQTGVQSVISVTDNLAFTSLSVAVQIEHSYIGDVVVELRHGGKTVTLQNQEGGASSGLNKTFRPIGFAGQSSQGDWTLLLSDRAAQDSGRLTRWAITFTK